MTYIPLLTRATGTTLLLWASSSLISFTVGLLLGTIRCTQLRIPIVSQLADGVTLLLRGVPLYAQLMIAYFVVPSLLGIAPSAFLTGIITLGLCSGAYASEIVRGTFNTIDKGQWRASQTLGYTKWQQLYYVVGPQMLINAFPTLGNEYLMVLKSTAILASIGVLELTKIGTNIMYRTFNPLPVCFSIAAVYLGLSAILTVITSYIERKFYAYR